MNEIFKKIVGFEGYLIGNNGTVKSIDRDIHYKDGRIRHFKGQILKQHINPNGYLQVTLKIRKSNPVYIHKLVAKAFIPNPRNLPCVNHIDGNKLNNNVNNLEWCSYSDNNKHSYTYLKHKKPKSEGLPFRIQAINIFSNEVLIFSSIRKTSKFLKISKSHIIRLLNSDKNTKNGWKFIRMV